MQRIFKRTGMTLLTLGLAAALTACGGDKTPAAEGGKTPTGTGSASTSGNGSSGGGAAGANNNASNGGSTSAGSGASGSNASNNSGTSSNANGNSGSNVAGGTNSGSSSGGGTSGTSGTSGSGSTNGDKVVSKPADIAVLVNKTYKLPDNYKPDDLVEPNIPFIFKEQSEKRLMRKEAAGALEKLVAAAKKDGIYLAGVSGYRSQSTQKSLFDNYAKKDGEAAALLYSAPPGHSEHQTGLAMDVSGSDGKCAASDCFAGTKEAKWLADHADEHGFIIRFPKGKEAITGYQYEPWHLRYVGTKIAKDIADSGLTLEEYIEKGVPVSK
ncbi:MAG: peptidase [Paenibacillus sp.]|nr:peptidase [Paenibacillus sp.]